MNLCPHETNLTPYLLGDLPPSAAEAVRRHLEICAACRAEAAALAPVLASLREALSAAADTPAGLTSNRLARVLAVQPEDPGQSRTQGWMAFPWFRRRQGRTRHASRPHRKDPSPRHLNPWSALARPDLFRRHRWLAPALATAATLALLFGVVLPAMFTGGMSRRSHSIMTLSSSEPSYDDGRVMPAGDAAPADLAVGFAQASFDWADADMPVAAQQAAAEESYRGDRRRPATTVSGIHLEGAEAAAPSPAARPAPSRAAPALPSGPRPVVEQPAASSMPQPLHFDTPTITRSPMLMRSRRGSADGEPVPAAQAVDAEDVVVSMDWPKDAADERLLQQAEQTLDVAAGLPRAAAAPEEKKSTAEEKRRQVLAEREAMERQDRKLELVNEIQYAKENRDNLREQYEVLARKDAELNADPAAPSPEPRSGPPATPAPSRPAETLALADRTVEDLQQELALVENEFEGIKRQFSEIEKTYVDLIHSGPSASDAGWFAPMTGKEQPAEKSERLRASRTEPTVFADDLFAFDPTPAPPPPPPPTFNPVVETAEQPLSTFAIDVDTAAYTLARQSLLHGQLPAPSSVRTEEVVNAFDYGDRAPEHATFRIFAEGAPAPFAPGRQLVRLGIKGRRLGREEQRPAMLTFLVDASGSMAQPDRIGLARSALADLTANLGPGDQLQLLAFNEAARVVLAPTPATERDAILAAFDSIQPTGPTNLERGMALAYRQAAGSFVPGAENRVVLLSDGVANLGTGEAGDILAQIDSARRQGITLAVFGVGRGAYNDALLEKLANQGDGTYRFLDSAEEVRRVFVDDLAATLYTIAGDVKIQVEWNPAAVVRYRQLGYENRALTAEQFRDDTVDAGEVGSGQAVTALYEIELAEPQAGQRRLAPDEPLGTVRVRYRPVGGGPVEEISRPILPSDLAASIQAARPHFRVAAGAGAFAERLRRSPHAANVRFDAVAELLRPAALELALDTRIAELVRLVEAADALTR